MMASNHCLIEIVKEWIEEKSVQDARAEYPELISRFGCTNFISELASSYWSKQRRIVERISLTDSSFFPLSNVHTIAVYYYRLRNGGIERVISLLLPLWLELGYKIILLTEEAATDEDYPIPQSIERVLLPKVTQCKAANYQCRAEAWENIIAEHQIDTIVYEAWDSAFLFWDACVIKGLGCHLVSGVHGTYTYLFREQVRQRFDLFRAYHLVDRAVVLSHSFEGFWNHFCPSRYIPNPVHISPSEDCSTLTGDIILWVGRFIEEKNPKDAIRMFAKVKSSTPASSLIMLGTGEPEVVNSVKALARELGLESSVLFPGYHKEISDYYKKASVLLFTSSFEGFPMTIAEAKSHGLPIVMYDLPYCEMVRDRRGIISVPQGDIAGLAHSLQNYLALDVKERLALGNASRESAESFATFDLKKAWQELFDGLVIPSKASFANRDVDVEFLLDNIEFGESKISNYLSEVLAGKDWLEQHSAEQERWISELQNGKDWLEQQVQMRETQIHELQSDKECLKQQVLAGETKIHTLQSNCSELTAACQRQEAALRSAQEQLDMLQQENESLRHVKGWLKYKLHALHRTIQ